MNKAFVLGHLGKDPETSATPSGKLVAKFTVATSEKKDGPTEWHNVVAWEKTAELCGKYLAKGSQVLVEGRMQTTSWDDKATGQKRYRTEIVASNVQFINFKKDGSLTRENLDANVDGEPKEELVW